ncbi:uncharacterized protein LOC127848628 [Dreissena polymorpha]|nr:uncharacterized protein LOC127848628 [Dreissena polymorpha]
MSLQQAVKLEMNEVVKHQGELVTDGVNELSTEVVSEQPKEVLSNIKGFERSEDAAGAKETNVKEKSSEQSNANIVTDKSERSVTEQAKEMSSQQAVKLETNEVVKQPGESVTDGVTSSSTEVDSEQPKEVLRNIKGFERSEDAPVAKKKNVEEMSSEQSNANIVTDKTERSVTKQGKEMSSQQAVNVETNKDITQLGESVTDGVTASATAVVAEPPKEEDDITNHVDQTNERTLVTQQAVKISEQSAELGTNKIVNQTGESVTDGVAAMSPKVVSEQSKDIIEHLDETLSEFTARLAKQQQMSRKELSKKGVSEQQTKIASKGKGFEQSGDSAIAKETNVKGESTGQNNANTLTEQSDRSVTEQAREMSSQQPVKVETNEAVKQTGESVTDGVTSEVAESPKEVDNNNICVEQPEESVLTNVTPVTGESTEQKNADIVSKQPETLVTKPSNEMTPEQSVVLQTNSVDKQTGKPITDGITASSVAVVAEPPKEEYAITKETSVTGESTEQKNADIVPKQPNTLVIEHAREMISEQSVVLKTNECVRQTASLTAAVAELPNEIDNSKTFVDRTDESAMTNVTRVNGESSNQMNANLISEQPDTLFTEQVRELISEQSAVLNTNKVVTQTGESINVQSSEIAPGQLGKGNIIQQSNESMKTHKTENTDQLFESKILDAEKVTVEKHTTTIR